MVGVQRDGEVCVEAIVDVSQQEEARVRRQGQLCIKDR